MTTWQTKTYEALNQRVVGLVGGKTAQEFEKLGVRTVGDLLRYPPRRYIAGTEMSDFSTLRIGDDVALVARVYRLDHAFGRKQRLVVTLTDGSGQYLSATFFAARDHLIKYWQRVLSVGVRGIFIGKIGEFNGHLQLSHPDFVVLDANNHVVAGKAGEREAITRATQRSTLVGIYPATAKLPTWVIADSASMALEVSDTLIETYPEWVVEHSGVQPISSAFRHLHSPVDLRDAEIGLRRLRFDEALMTQLALSYRRAARQQVSVDPILPAAGGTLAAFDQQLPFELTEGQLAASAEIFSDIAKPRPMSRLLQGEVGSGKTVVALRAMLAAVDAGGQAALLAPTEVLARQHLRSITKLLGELGHGVLGRGIRIGLLTGSQPAAVRRETQDQLASGELDLVVGTHALLGEGVNFANLSLVVVDEQHRFGVEQRAALGAKGHTEPHMLVMTATPIPRTVAMTVFGDLEVTELTQLPAGRAEVKTVYVNTLRHPNWVSRAWARVREEVEAGRQVFIVCPRIDPDDAESDDAWEDDGEAATPLTSVTSLAADLAAGPLAGLRLGIAHGSQSAAERDQTMRDFADGGLDVLVATTVIEVGVDVPNASMMVVMDADRFGLAQLHQLRGRIGRGSHPGLCLLLAPLTDDDGIAARRLGAMVASRDGFVLAEEDLQLRREGNVLGAEQSGGASALRTLRVLEDSDIIIMAREIAERVTAEDPSGSSGWVADLLTQADTAGYWAERN